MFRVVYLWRGERYTHPRSFAGMSEAVAVASEMRRQKWNAWVE